MDNKKKVVIVGGGITGLTSAYYLQKEIKERDLPFEVTLIESTNRLGGKVKTIYKEGFTIERGPDSFLARKKSALNLVKELGLVDKLVRNEAGQSYILVGRKLHKIPKGSHMGIPIDLRPFLFSNLLSLKAKARTGFDFLIPKGKKKEDQSLGSFFRHRFGNDLVENVIEPLLSGIYAGDIDRMSLMATFPNFYEVEQQYGSLMKGLKKTTEPKQKGKQPGKFFSLTSGLESLIKALEEKLDRNTIKLNSHVVHVEKKEHGYHLLLDSGEVQEADSIIMATPHTPLPKMFSQFDFFKELKQVPSTSVANVSLSFDKNALTKDINGTGFVVSRNSDYRITACTWTHKKWPNSTPKEKVLLRCYVGKPNDQLIVDLTDKEIIEIVLHDLNKIMKITKQPEQCIVTRWKNAMPQYTIGHRERIEKLRNEMKNHLPGLFLTGSSYEGVGIPDCIKQGEQASRHVLDYFKEKNE